MPNAIHRISIFGVGLIGGSLGLAWKARRPDIEIVGLDKRDILERAISLGAIDTVADDLASAIHGSDIIILSAPTRTNQSLLQKLAAVVERGVVVSDTGSVKHPIHSLASEVLPSGVTFIGGHPMAGSEYCGIESASEYLFENATYALCPLRSLGPLTENPRTAGFVELIELLGARILVLDPETHDRASATVSHLPQLLAVTLTDLVGNAATENALFLQLAAGGFRDMTRIASSPFELWSDILLGNKGMIQDVLALFSAQLQSLRNRIADEDMSAIREAFARAASIRNTIPRDARGFLSPLYEILVSVADEPGALASLTGGLFASNVNIKDIALLKIRSGVGGTFRLGFDSQAEAMAAVSCLRKIGFEVRAL